MRIVVFAAAGFLAGLGAGAGIKAVQVRGAVLAEKAAKEAAAHGDGRKEHPERRPEGDLARTGQDTLSGGTPEAGTGLPGDSVSPASGPAGRAEVAALPAPESGSGASSSVVDDRSGGARLAGTPPSAEPGSAPEVISDGSARLAKIFSAMEAKDAAAVLAKLEDEEVRAILAHMSDRKAAEVLGAFPPDRAATLSRSLLAIRLGRGR